MSFLSGFSERIDVLVHDSVRHDEAVSLAHANFIASRLLLAFAALIALPLFLALRGAPALADVLAFAVVLGPIAAVTFVVRTGRLLTGQKISIASWLLAATVLSLGGQPVTGAALVWFALAPVEAWLTGCRRVILATGGAAAALAAGVLLTRFAGPAGQTAAVSLVSEFAIVAVAIVYVTVLAAGAARENGLYRHAAAAQRLRYRALAGAIGDGVLQMDRSGVVSYVGGACGRLLGLQPREFMGRGLFDRIHVGDRPAFLKAITDAAATGNAVAVELRIRVPDAGGGDYGIRYDWFELRANRMPAPGDREDAGGDRIVAVVRDITGKIEHEMELERARKEAECANLWKDRFVANVSHELRTPLNAIIGFAEILASPQIAPSNPEKTREYAGIIHESGEHLLTVVNSILDISKIEAGSFDIHPEVFGLTPLIENCIDMLRLRAEKGGVDLAMEIDAAVPEIVADKRSVRQILINLVSNAIKFTPEGGTITVGLRLDGDMVVLSVRDTGIGIIESELPKLGMPFFQASDTYARSYEGTGLGLSVVRGLVGLHAGAIRLESAPGAGTIVSVRLPVDCQRASRCDCAPAVIEVFPLRQPGKIMAGFKDIGVKKIA